MREHDAMGGKEGKKSRLLFVFCLRELHAHGHRAEITWIGNEKSIVRAEASSRPTRATSGTVWKRNTRDHLSDAGKERKDE